MDDVIQEHEQKFNESFWQWAKASDFFNDKPMVRYSEYMSVGEQDERHRVAGQTGRSALF